MKPQVDDLQTAGNHATVHPLACGPITSIKNSDIPPDIYAGMLVCASDSRYAEAVNFFAVAGVFSYFDAERVTDITAQQAHQVMTQQAMSTLDPPAKTALWQQIRDTLSDDAKRSVICADVRRIGAPTYKPEYMIQHGMDAVAGKAQVNGGLVANFDSKDAWEKAVDGYLHCPAK
jgi:hypothetical protein